MGFTRAGANAFLEPFLLLPAPEYILGWNTVDRSAGIVHSEGVLDRQFNMHGGLKIGGTGRGVPYLEFDGATGYLDAPDADYQDQPTGDGFSLVACIFLTDNSVRHTLLAKNPTGGDNSYYWDAAYSSVTTQRFNVSSDGTDNFGIQASTVINALRFVHARYTPGAEVQTGVGSSFAKNVTSIPASLHNSSGATFIGRAGSSAVQWFVGRVAVIAKCALLDDAYLRFLNQHCVDHGVG